MQESIFWYVAQCLTIYVVVGIAVYFLDRKVIVPVGRWFYDLSHKTKLPPSRYKGLLYGQKTQWRMSVAFFISTAQSIYMVWTAGVNPTVELIMWILEVPTMLLGFMLGYPLHQMYLKRSKVYDTIDSINVEELGHGARERLDRAPTRAKEFLSSVGLAMQAWAIEMASLVRRRRESSADVQASADVQSSEPLRAAPAAGPAEPDPMDVIKKFIGKAG